MICCPIYLAELRANMVRVKTKTANGEEAVPPPVKLV